MYGTIHMYSIVHDNVHIYGTMTWHWLMMWYWPMKCHDTIGLKFLSKIGQRRICGVVSGPKIARPVHANTWNCLQSNRVTIQTAWSNRVVKPCHYSNRVLLTDDMAQSWASKMFLIWWQWFIQCIYKKGGSHSNLASLNSFFNSIFCNSFYILYFLRILINFYFTPSWSPYYKSRSKIKEVKNKSKDFFVK